MSSESVGKRHTERQPESRPEVDAGSSRESSRWVLKHFPYLRLSVVVLMHLPEVLSLCARLLQETFRCFPHTMSFLHSCQFTLCVPLLASILCHQSSKKAISIRFKAELKFLHRHSRVSWLWMEPFFLIIFFSLLSHSSPGGLCAPRVKFWELYRNRGIYPSYLKAGR